MKNGTNTITVKEKMFCAEYIREHNVAASARKAGYKCPKQSGYRLLRKTIIKNHIAALEAQLKQAEAQALKEQYSYHIPKFFQDLELVKGLALKRKRFAPDGGCYIDPDLQAYLKSCELQAKTSGLFALDNQQKSNLTIDIPQIIDDSEKGEE